MPRLCFGVGLDEDGERCALDAVGDPSFGAVDDVTVAVAPRDRADALQIRTGVRFGQADAAANLTGRKFR